MVTCRGCLRSFSLAGYTQHLQRTSLPACKAIYDALENYVPQSGSSHQPADGLNSDLPGADTIPQARFQGDFFRENYARGEDFEMEDDGQGKDWLPALEAEGDSDESDDEYQNDLESRWEPPVSYPPSRIPGDHSGEIMDAQSDSDKEEDPDSSRTRTARARAEDAARRQPAVTKFPGGAAGKPVNTSELRASMYEEYSHQMNASADNPWAPFASKLDWEVARWAKLRGPGSTALTELLQIDGRATALHGILRVLRSEQYFNYTMYFLLK